MSAIVLGKEINESLLRPETHIGSFTSLLADLICDSCKCGDPSLSGVQMRGVEAGVLDWTRCSPHPELPVVVDPPVAVPAVFFFPLKQHQYPVASILRHV